LVENYLELDNPLSQDKPFLRRNLLPNLLENTARALGDNNEVKIFEIGKVFRGHESGARVRANSDELLPGQDVWFTCVCASKKDKMPFWQARRVLEILMSSLGYTWEVVVKLDPPVAWEHPARVFLFNVNGTTCGVVHEVNPVVSEKYGIDYRAAAVSIKLSVLVELAKKPILHQTTVSYPSVTRDIAFMAKKELAHAAVEEALVHIDHLLIKVELFDIYEGATIGEEYKSMAYRLTFSHAERTLKTDEVDAVMIKVKKAITDLGGEMRG